MLVSSTKVTGLRASGNIMMYSLLINYRIEGIYVGAKFFENAIFVLEYNFHGFYFHVSRMQQLTTPSRVTPLYSSHVEKHRPGCQLPSDMAFLHQEQWSSYPCRLGSLSLSPQEKIMKPIPSICSLYLCKTS